ncbi:MAG: SLC45 family MFS transporter [Anaerolineae bacterium]|nr:SLC45 family MFS transporter [Anaerolineae bacterium]MDH7474619.1 SLC45 family MFS transporter [Anaerolineae bacterium]
MKLNYKRTFLLGLGFFGISVIWSIYNSYIPPFLRQYELPWWLVGFVMTFDNIAGLIIQPYVGQLSDRTRTRLGRRMPYILVGAPIAALFWMLIPVIHLTMPHVTSTLVLLTGAIILMNIAMAIFRTPTVALMPDITPSPLRSKANGIINLMGGLGTTLAFLGGAFLYKMYPGLPFWVGGVIMLVAEIILILVIREPQEYYSHADVPTDPRPGLFDTLLLTLRDVGQVIRDPEKSALFIFLAIFTWFVGYNAIETFWTSYGREVLYAGQIVAGQMTADQAVAKASGMLTYISAVFLIFALPAGFIATRFGRKRTIMTGLVILMAMWLGIYFIHADLYVIATLILSGIGWALININSLPIVVDLVPEEKVGSYTGLYYFFSMAAAITAPPLVGALMDLLGVQVMFLFTPLFMLLAFLCMCGVRRSEPEAAPDTATSR